MYVSSMVNFLLIDGFSSLGITHKQTPERMHALKMLKVYKGTDY